MSRGHFPLRLIPVSLSITIMSAFDDMDEGYEGALVDIDEDFDVDAMSDVEADDEDESGEFMALVMRLCGQRVAENELTGRVETEDEVFSAVMGSAEIANYMVSTGAIKSAGDHAQANDNALKGVSQLEIDKANNAMASSTVTIVDYTGDQVMHERVRNLLIDGLTHQGDTSNPQVQAMNKWVVKTALESDLTNIKRFYIDEGMPFLVAVIEVKSEGKTEEEIVGCGGLAKAGALSSTYEVEALDPHKGNHECEIVCLSVHKHYRRHGIGTTLVSRLEDRARTLGYEAVTATVLESSSSNINSEEKHSGHPGIGLLTGDRCNFVEVGSGVSVDTATLLGTSPSKTQRKKVASMQFTCHLLKKKL